MSTLTNEGLAAIRLMICMAKADGLLKQDERSALEDALAGASLPAGLTAELLLQETWDPRVLAEQIQSRDGRDYAYACVFSVAYCDREVAEPEERLLAMLREAWGIGKDEERALERVLDAHGHPEPSDTRVQPPVGDENERGETFQKLQRRYSLLAGITGAIWIPLLPDLLVVPLQVMLVYHVAGLFGQKTDRQTVQLMFETLGVGTGARLGISALCKLVPGWGSVVGATTSFATTYALGQVAYAYYKSEGKHSLESLKPLFRQQKEQGLEEYQKHKATLEEVQRTHSDTLSKLAYDLQHGRITAKEYEQKVDGLK